MKKMFAMLMALSMMLTMFAGCNTAPAPTDPTPAPESSSVPEPEPEPTIVEGVVKEASLSKIIVTLADGTDFALDTTKVTDMKVNLGDEVKVEYTGAPGSAVASKVDVTKAAPVPETVTGVVKEVSASMMLLTLEDETEIVLLTKDLPEEVEVAVGDKITATYLMGDTGAVASAVEVVEDATPDDGSSSGASDAGASSRSAAPAAPASPSGASTPASTPAPQQGGSTGGNGGNQLKSYVDWIKSIGTPEDGGDTSSGGNSSSDDTEDETPASKPTETQPENKPTETTPEPEPEPEPDEEAGDVYEAIRLINAERSKAGLAELTIDSDLMDAAAKRAEEQPESFGHTRPDGSDFSTIREEFNVTGSPICENAGRGKDTASKQVNSWMNSAGHKANILNASITRIGVGYCYGEGSTKKHYWIMLGIG